MPPALAEDQRQAASGGIEVITFGAFDLDQALDLVRLDK